MSKYSLKTGTNSDSVDCNLATGNLIILSFYSFCRYIDFPTTVRSSGSKVCSTPHCQGLLIANLANRRHAQNSSINLNVTCDSCKITQCWKCRSASHGSFSCMQVALCKREWVQFLKVLAGEGNGNPAASEALLKYEQSALDTLYFKRNITEGNLKKCPSCSKLIEKLQGCDSMVSYLSCPSRLLATC
jgi:hypothetical protein